MNKIFGKAVLLVVFVMPSFMVFAQEETESHATPRWISDKGYWIIESNIKIPGSSVIHFYNNNNQEVYSEKVEGITLNLKKRKTLMRLKKALEQSVDASEQPGMAKMNTELVSNIFNRKQKSW